MTSAADILRAVRKEPPHDLSKPFRGRVLIRPDLALRWLESNTRNRRVRRSLVDYLCAQITSGQWRPDMPSAILFGTDGVLLDGQHRLMAIASTGIACECEVVGGADIGLMPYIDTGVSRTVEDRHRFTDNLRVNRFCAQIINCLGVIGRGTVVRMSPHEVEAIFALAPKQILWAASEYAECRVPRVIVASVMTCITEFSVKHPEAAQSFLDSLRVVDGEVQPARYLRDWLMRCPTNGGMRGQVIRYWKTASALIAHQEGRKVTKLIGISAWPWPHPIAPTGFWNGEGWD